MRGESNESLLALAAKHEAPEQIARALRIADWPFGFSSFGDESFPWIAVAIDNQLDQVNARRSFTPGIQYLAFP
jgi:hypothetical protein